MHIPRFLRHMPLPAKLQKYIFRLLFKLHPPKPMTPEEYEKNKADAIQRNRSCDTDCLTLPEEVKQGISIERFDLPNCKGWLSTLPGNDPEKVIYYVHGGGFVAGYSKGGYPYISHIVRQQGYNVFSVDYRLAPEFMHPCAVNDCLDGYQQLLTRYEAGNIILLGESAGGNLVMSLGLLLRDKGLPLPGGICSCSPVLQFSEYFPSFHENAGKHDFGILFGCLEMTNGLYFRNEDKEDPYVAPLYGDVAGLPPVFLNADRYESLRDDAIAMYEKLKAAGVPTKLHLFEDLGHAAVCHFYKKRVQKEIYPVLFGFIRDCFQGTLPKE